MGMKIKIFRGFISICLLIWLSGCFSIKPSFPPIDTASLTQDQVKTLATLEKVDDHPLYVMHYYGDYSFFSKLKQKYYKELGLPKPKCSTFVAFNPTGDAIYGHNNDTDRHPVLLLFTNPSDGYASFSVVEIVEAYNVGKKPPFDSTQARTTLLYTPYFIADGINEWGLAVGDMSEPSSNASFDPNKETMFSSEAKRYLLDHAKNTNEAIGILSKYNIIMGTIPNHLLIADSSGDSVIIEWVNGQMQLIRNKEAWQVATNFMIYRSQDKIKEYTVEYNASGKIAKDINGKSYWRYITAWETLKKMQGQISSDDAMKLLETVSLVRSKEIWWPTQWSVVYNLNTGDIQIALGRNYNKIYRYKLKMKK
jgi:hypothetical protein